MKILQSSRYFFLLISITIVNFNIQAEPVHKKDNHSKKHSKTLYNLSSYNDISKELSKIERRSRHRIEVGPLINNNSKGLVNIDIPLDSNLPINMNVCGIDSENTTIREAVICTVNDGGRGNKDGSKIGQSTQGRNLLAAKLGNPDGKKVMIITQQHGNEPAGTEAVLRVLKKLSHSHSKFSRKVLSQLNILVLVRANPDGGEPDTDKCSIDPAVGSIMINDCAFIRQNVDPDAGGSFLSNSEIDFSGIVGRGYDLNRYHHVGLNNPIRPVENQAMVASVLAFQPSVILDLHGDLHKTDCQIDFSTIQTGQVLGLLPTAECINPDSKDDFRLLSPFADAQPNTPSEFLVQSLSAEVMKQTEKIFKGSVGRFSQVQLGSGNIGNGATGNYQQLGIAAGGWETVNFSKELRADVVAVVQGQPVVSVNPGLPDPNLLKRQIKINEVALMQALISLGRFSNNEPLDGGEFCDYPFSTGLFANLPAKYWGGAATNGDVMVPISPTLGVPLYISGNCPDSPQN